MLLAFLSDLNGLSDEADEDRCWSDGTKRKLFALVIVANLDKLWDMYK